MFKRQVTWVFSEKKSFLFTVGSPALTSRGMKESEFAQVAEFLHQGIQIAVDIQKKTSK